MELDRLEQELGDTPDGCLKRTESQWGIWQFQIKFIVDGLPSLPIHPCSSGPCTAPKNPTCQLGFLGTYLQLFKNAGWIYSASQGICRRLVILSKDQPSVWFSQQGAQHSKTHDIVWWPWFIIRDWLEYIWTQYSAPLSWGEATLSLFTVDDKTGQKGRQGYQQKIGEESWKGARHVLSNPFKPHQKGPIQLQVDLFYIMWPWPIPCHRLSTWWPTLYKLLMVWGAVDTGFQSIIYICEFKSLSPIKNNRPTLKYTTIFFSSYMIGYPYISPALRPAKMLARSSRMQTTLIWPNSRHSDLMSLEQTEIYMIT